MPCKIKPVSIAIISQFLLILISLFFVFSLEEMAFGGEKNLITKQNNKITKDSNSEIHSSTSQKKKYSEAQKQRVLKKIEELNKDPSLSYDHLTREEQLIRLEIWKSNN